LVHSAPRWQRGSIARVLAGHIVVAARADAYTKRRIAPDLEQRLQAAVAEVRRRKADRPARTARPAPKKRHGTRSRRPR
jgi:nucleolar protein 56